MHAIVVLEVTFALVEYEAASHQHFGGRQQFCGGSGTRRRDISGSDYWLPLQCIRIETPHVVVEVIDLVLVAISAAEDVHAIEHHPTRHCCAR